MICGESFLHEWLKEMIPCNAILITPYIYPLCSVSGKGILSGHADGTIVRYFFDDEGSGESQVRKSLSSFSYQTKPVKKWV